MPTVYRLLREKYKTDPLSVEGSRLFGGRWNPKGTGVLYTTSSPELGLIESLAHAPATPYQELPAYWVFAIDVPDDIRQVHRDELPDFWLDDTYERTQHWLAAWLLAPDSLGVAVPSVLVPLSYNIILHPAHPLFTEVQVTGAETQPIDRRIWRNS